MQRPPLERNQCTDFAFAETNIESFVPGVSGKKSQEKGKNRLKDSASAFGVRLQQFIDDMLLLYYFSERGDNSIIEDSDWSEMLRQLEKVEYREENVDYDIWFSDPNPPENEWEFSPYERAFESLEAAPTIKTQEQANLGAALAQLVRPIHETRTETEINHTDLVWGFIIGLLGQPIEEFENEHDTLERLLSKLRSRADLRRWYSINQLRVSDSGTLSTVEKDLIRGLGYEPTKPFCLAYSEAELSAMHDSSHQKPVHTNDAPGSPPELMTETIDILLEETDLDEIKQLLDDIKEDEELISTRAWRQVDGEVVFRQIYSGAEDSLTGINVIEEKVSTPGSVSENQTRERIVKILNDYAGKKVGTVGKDWTDPPLISEHSNGWKTTDYGDLVGRVMYEDGHEQLHAYAFNGHMTVPQVSDEISETFDESITKKVEPVLTQKLTDEPE